MTGKRTNLAASVLARLLNRAKHTGDDYQTVLTGYCFERFLYRLGLSGVRDRFVLKGAMLLGIWSDRPYRATRDLDLLHLGDNSIAAIHEDLRAACATPAPADAVVFDADHIGIEPIRVEDEYAGTRATLPASCGTARLVLQIDMGVGDSVWPAPGLSTFPVLLDLPAPEVLTYPREAVVAEKFEAMVALGDRNSRIKDFFDLHYLASRFEFDRATLTEAVRRTFARRGTPIPTDEPIGLTPSYWKNPSRPAQVRAFAKRAGLAVPAEAGEGFVPVLGSFLLPVLADLRRSTPREGVWHPGGPWQ
jgi:hypothetical protein